METKQCLKCLSVKKIEEFNFKNKLKNKRRAQCKICDSENHKGLYRNSEKRRNDVKNRARVNTEWNRLFVRRYKTLVGCKDCGVKKYYLLDFHHNENKEANISAMVTQVALKTLKLEIKKCTILCANCHRERHWIERIRCSNSVVE